jgi:hypothetical protein
MAISGRVLPFVTWAARTQTPSSSRLRHVSDSAGSLSCRNGMMLHCSPACEGRREAGPALLQAPFLGDF